MNTIEEKSISLPPSVLTKKQTKTFRWDNAPTKGREPVTIIAEVRHDDECGNGHNTFAVTAEIYGLEYHRGEPSVEHPNGNKLYMHSCGCCHEEIAEHFPELAPLIKWHGTSTDQPTHYVANGLYWAGHQGFRDGKDNSPPNLAYLEGTVIWGVLPGETRSFSRAGVSLIPSKEPGALADYLYSNARGFTWNEAKAHALEDILKARLPALMVEFKKAVESIGLVY